MKITLNKDFIVLFCRPKEVLSDKKASFNEEIILNVSEVKPDTSSKIVLDTSSQRRQSQSFRDYASKNISIGAVKKIIKDEIMSSKDIELKTLITKTQNKLGLIYKAKAKLNNEEMDVAARIIKFAKIPSYLIEGLYLEMAYYKENVHPSLVLILGVACEPPTLYLLSAWKGLSLHHFIYSEGTSDKERLKMIL